MQQRFAAMNRIRPAFFIKDTKENSKPIKQREQGQRVQPAFNAKCGPQHNYTHSEDSPKTEVSILQGSDGQEVQSSLKREDVAPQQNSNEKPEPHEPQLQPLPAATTDQEDVAPQQNSNEKPEPHEPQLQPLPAATTDQEDGPPQKNPMEEPEPQEISPQPLPATPMNQEDGTPQQNPTEKPEAQEHSPPPLLAAPMEQEDGPPHQKENHANPVREPKQQGFTQPQPLPATPLEQENGQPQQNRTESGEDPEQGQGRTKAVEAETGAIPKALPRKRVVGQKPVAPKDGSGGKKPGNQSEAGEGQKGKWNVSTLSKKNWIFCKRQFLCLFSCLVSLYGWMLQALTQLFINEKMCQGLEHPVTKSA